MFPPGSLLAVAIPAATEAVLCIMHPLLHVHAEAAEEEHHVNLGIYIELMLTKCDLTTTAAVLLLLMMVTKSDLTTTMLLLMMATKSDLTTTMLLLMMVTKSDLMTTMLLLMMVTKSDLMTTVLLLMMRGPCRPLLLGHALSQTGGHGDMRGKGEDCCACGAALRGIGRVCDGEVEVRRAARDELRKGAHCIKVMASGGVASPTDRCDDQAAPLPLPLPLKVMVSGGVVSPTIGAMTRLPPSPSPYTEKPAPLPLPLPRPAPPRPYTGQLAPLLLLLPLPLPLPDPTQESLPPSPSPCPSPPSPPHRPVCRATCGCPLTCPHLPLPEHTQSVDRHSDVPPLPVPTPLV